MYLVRGFFLGPVQGVIATQPELRGHLVTQRTELHAAELLNGLRS